MVLIGSQWLASSVDLVDSSFETVSIDEGNKTTYTFSDFDLGDSGTKKIVVVVWNNDGSTPEISSVTVAGSAASVVVAGKSAAQCYDAQIFQIESIEAATGDVVVVMGNGISALGIATYAVVGAATSATDTGTSTAIPGTYDIDVSAGGVVIACANAQAGSGGTHAWVGVDEDCDQSINTSATCSSASKVFSAAQTNLTVTCTYSGSPITNLTSFAAASWGPA